MNPFDLRGPQFLLFYAVVSAAVIGLLAWGLVRRRSADLARAKAPLEDPILIAYLRGGRQEAVAVAIASLVDRGLLKVVEGGALDAVVSPSRPARPIEQAILEACAAPRASFRSCCNDRSVRAICDSYGVELQRLGIIPSGSSLARDFALAAIAGAILLGVGALKIDVALARGHRNIGLLVFLMIADVIAILVVVFKIRGGAAASAVSDLRVLFSDLRRRGSKLVRGRSTNDLEYLAAVFGASMLPLTAFPDRDALFPHPALALRDRRDRGPDHWGGTCGSVGAACGGVSGCGSGSGGGGGGCGGGGCGGCGS